MTVFSTVKLNTSMFYCYEEYAEFRRQSYKSSTNAEMAAQCCIREIFTVTHLSHNIFVCMKTMLNGCFPCKITLHLKKVCYKVSLWEKNGKLKCVVTYANSLASVRCVAVAKRPCDCSYFIFARSASAETPSANSL